jgi:hypothetical protein
MTRDCTYALQEITYPSLDMQVCGGRDLVVRARVCCTGIHVYDSYPRSGYQRES